MSVLIGCVIGIVAFNVGFLAGAWWKSQFRTPPAEAGFYDVDADQQPGQHQPKVVRLATSQSRRRSF